VVPLRSRQQKGVPEDVLIALISIKADGPFRGEVLVQEFFQSDQRRDDMAETTTKVPVEIKKAEPAPTEWRPFESLRREVDRLFDDFRLGSWRSPFERRLLDFEPFWRSSEGGWPKVPAVDVAETQTGYEVTAELPGMDEKSIDVNLADGVLTIRGEKKEEKEEKKKDYYVSERRFGSFQRSFTVPNGVDADQIEAHFKNGILVVKLPKSAQARQNEKKIEIKTAA
jgi:HSP20 family protein